MVETSWTYVCLTDVRIILDITFFNLKIGDIWSPSYIENQEFEDWIDTFPKKPKITIFNSRNLTRTRFQYCDKDGATHWRDYKLTDAELKEYELIILCYKDEFGSEGSPESVVIEFEQPAELVMFKMLWLD